MATGGETTLRAGLTSYVGRTAESGEIRRLLGTARLVTLTGPGGVGKTRLAAQVATTVSRAFTDGVVDVALAEVRDARLLTGLLAHRLGLYDQSNQSRVDAVLDHLREQRVLLVLDNCEHLVDGCAELVSTLLRWCPHLVVLTTSRRSLGVAGEHVLTVPPLTLPPDDLPSPGDLLAYDAVRLFVERARSMCSSFRLTSDNGQDVVRVCRQVDGLPLAVELAAARIRALSPRQIADRLDDRLALLSTGEHGVPDRQRSLRATVDWSFALCTEVERAVWSRCSVFAGSFDLAGAEYVCAGEGVRRGEVLAAVDSLIDMSVLLREESGPTVRYRMLEVLRDYGHERLVDRGEEVVLARRHRDYYDQLTENADNEWFGPRQLEWMDRLRAEHANLRVALAWSLRAPGEASAALRIATRVFEYWAMRGSAREGRDWIDRALAAVPDETEGRAIALSMSALCALVHSDLPLARARLDEADRLDDPEAHAQLTYVRSFAAMMSIEPAVELAAEAVRAFAAKAASGGRCIRCSSRASRWPTGEIWRPRGRCCAGCCRYPRTRAKATTARWPCSGSVSSRCGSATWASPRRRWSRHFGSICVPGTGWPPPTGSTGSPGSPPGRASTNGPRRCSASRRPCGNAAARSRMSRCRSRTGCSSMPPATRCGPSGSSGPSPRAGRRRRRTWPCARMTAVPPGHHRPASRCPR
ncbi:Predicted ATPase [Amycolatopsis marina]|uniref:Predicted ATPase n=1 Tax=Amycolatopsis marina TaxID=490629 RepID=A0A1I0V721_9PSEU|nr:AAA family ATPase [Amycolatopsis marina]SFA72139.1 Predicted ATPase [Amycolatopsis marina]